MATDLKSILQRKREYAERNERPKIEWFSLKNGGSAKVVFLQELDEDLADSKGSAIYLVEHTSPQDFKRRAECTFDEEAGTRCFACEMNQEEPNNSWWAKTNFYVQVYVETKDDKPGEGSVKVLSRPVSNKEGGFFDLLYEWAIEENGGKVTGRTFTISKGAEKTSPWSLMPTTKMLQVPENVELVDLETLKRTIPYEQQRNFYLPKGDEVTEEDDGEEKATKPKQTNKLAW